MDEESTQRTGGGSTSERGSAERGFDGALTRDETPTSDDASAFDGLVTRDGALTPELRAEIKDVLRGSGEGLSHGATFQLREQGLGDAEIAARRGVTVGTTRGFLRSLDDLLNGELPTARAAALRNSYVYRELLNHPRSDTLDSYVKAQLRRLKETNSEVSFNLLETRTHQYRVGKRTQEKPIEDPCPECAAVGIIHPGRC